jgi:CubicO group peptidase (beta-lactamase class C family)
LGITQAGFGAPGRSGRFDQPQGHRATADGPAPLDPADRASDNPPALGPAGTINMALRDWLLFAQDQLDGVHGRGKLLKAETYRQLQTPVTNDYALGWGVRLGPDGAPLLLAHAGSNGFWFAEVRILPRHGMIFLVATNVGGEAATQSAAAIVHALTDRLRRRNEAPAKLPRP